MTFKLTLLEVAELEEYVQLLNDELGESIQLMCSLIRLDYTYPEEFEQQLHKQLRRKLKWLRDTYTVEVYTINEPVTIRTLVKK